MITKITSPLYDQLIADFEVRSIISSSSETEELLELRENAFEQFKKLGFPNTKVEDWKYTNLSPFLKQEFITEQEDETFNVSDEQIAQAKIKSFDCYNIILVNGRYQPGLSDVVTDEAVSVTTIASAIGKPAFNAHFGKYTNVEKNHFAALNTGLFSDGLFVEIKSKAVIDRPLHIIHIVTANNSIFIQPRFLFITGAHAEVTIVESFVSAKSNADIFVSNVSEITLGENAHLHHYYIQTGNANTRYVHHTEVHQKTSSVYNNYKASFPGTALLRNNLNIALDGENIESHLYGIYLAGGNQVVDNHTIVDHRKPHCQSNELYKGVMKDEAIAVFNGKIFVQKQAQKTNAFQQNNNLMLSQKAVVDSKPQLEIFADDVKCSHGSTVGQFNKEALFYLKSRGIGDEKAKALLIHAFAYDVTEKIPHAAVKSHINHLLEEGLK